ncbi:MAG: hypothetical protein ACTSY1_02865 [Alphaproteobacteria bacterium]
MTQVAKIAIIVETDQAVGIGFARDLARLGLDSVIASDVGRALECMAATDPAVILASSDVVGPAAIRRLVRATRGETAVILVARSIDVHLISAAIWHGAAECLMRPFDPNILEFKLQQTGVFGTAPMQNSANPAAKPTVGGAEETSPVNQCAAAITAS